MTLEQMPNIYEPWFPVDGLPTALNCEAIHDDRDGLRIILQENEQSASFLQVAFDSDFAYRKLDEGDFLLTPGELPTGNRSFFYIARQSEFLTWFNRESFETKSTLGLCEYLIVTSTDCISVLALSPPTLTWVSNKSDKGSRNSS